MNKQITLEEAISRVHDGMTIMFGGFLGVGSAVQIIDALVEKGVKDLTIIQMIRRMIMSHMVNLLLIIRLRKP